MAFSFAKQYNSRKLFDVDTTEFEYLNLEELFVQTGSDPQLIHEVKGVYINTKGKFDDSPVLATEHCYVNLPSHLTEVCRLMLDDERAIIAINNGKVGFKITKYLQKKYNKTCYSVEWCDM